VVGWELLRGRRRSAAVFATATIPAVLWWIYARIRFGSWFTSGASALGVPFVGWGQSLVSGRSVGHVSTLQHGLTVVALVALFVVFAIGAARALRLRSREDLAYLGLTALAACLAFNATAAFTTALRNVAFLVILVPFVLVPHKRNEGRALPAGQPTTVETIAE
jgi:hypothetical protein